ncbi:glycerol-3-phosphate 1-O-acyltransferase PlsY [Syntrophomonas palmitatica]|uniref:glycerol-3-phosphate 1-O-acyltransferase PlsY n=1 Tax=Syntrophomonas palmitatica TaxID=402877 RepID=UPI0006CFDECF|nr:glycerol-3-phosphate 1-O-acyltransferase PlsY [Syntrophomonas palmitatica]
MKSLGLVLLCYIIGSIPFSYLFPRIFARVDVRSRGSGNVGATNVFRTTGPLVAGLALGGDLFKGIIAAWIGNITGTNIMIIMCPAAAAIGHCYPVFLKFRGGKAVATSGGIVLFFMPKVGFILLALFGGITLITRYVSLASITVALFLPLLAMFMYQPAPYVVLCWILAVLVIYRHRENIIRLRAGTESKINDRA